MKRSFEIESDCLDIVRRIKTVDQNYYIVFNLDNQKFELHNRDQGKGTYCLTFPFDCLDERAYLHVLKTRVQNSDLIFQEIEEENKLLHQKQIKQVLNDFKEKIYES